MSKKNSFNKTLTSLEDLKSAFNSTENTVTAKENNNVESMYDFDFNDSDSSRANKALLKNKNIHHNTSKNVVSIEETRKIIEKKQKAKEIAKAINERRKKESKPIYTKETSRKLIIYVVPEIPGCCTCGNRNFVTHYKLINGMPITYSACSRCNTKYMPKLRYECGNYRKSLKSVQFITSSNKIDNTSILNEYNEYIKKQKEREKATIERRQQQINEAKKLAKEKELAEIEEDKKIQLNLFGSLFEEYSFIKFKDIYCEKCGERLFYVWDLGLKISKPSVLECLKCGEHKDIVLQTVYDRIETTNENEILKELNKSFKPFNDQENRATINNKVYSSTYQILNQNSNARFSLQLVDSANNHVTKGHQIKDAVIELPIRVKDEIGNVVYKTMNYKCHYCITCGEYFDFYNSFLKQIEIIGLTASDILISKKSYKYAFLNDFTNPFDSFSDESLLHSFGYCVGYSGLTESSRRRILKDLYDRGIMTIAEMKATINNNINMHGSKPSFECAIREWKDDLKYLNSLINND